MFGLCSSIDDDDAAGLAVEAVQRVVVADRVDRLAGELGDVDVGGRGDLAGDDAQTGGEQRLAGDATVGVLGEDGVEDGVADLVGHLVGVTLGHALGCEGPTGHGCSWLGVSGRWKGSGRAAASQVDDGVEDGVGDRPLVAKVDRHRVGVRHGGGRRRWCRARSLRRGADVVGDDEIEPLAPPASLGVGDEVVGLGGEPDQRLTGRACSGPSPARMSGVGSSTISGGPSCFFSLPAGRGLGPEVGDGGGHHDDVGGGVAAPSRASISAAVSTARRSTPAGSGGRPC